MFKKLYSVFFALKNYLRKVFKGKRPPSTDASRQGGIIVLSIDDQGFRMVRHLEHNGIVWVMVPAAMVNDEFMNELIQYFSRLL